MPITSLTAPVAPSLPPPAPGKPRSLWRRVLGVAGRVLVAALLVLLLALGWLTSPWGEGTLGNLVENLANKALQAQGLQLRLGGLSGLWKGQLRLHNVSMSDARGVWLSLPWLKVVLDVPALFSGRVALPLLELEDAVLARAPEVPETPEEPEPPLEPQPIRVMPAGWKLEIRDVRISALQVGEGEAARHIFARAHGEVGHDAALARVGVQLYAQPGVGFLPAQPRDVPQDILQQPELGGNPLEKATEPASTDRPRQSAPAQAARPRPPRDMPPPPVDARNTSTATLRETPVLGAVLNLRWQDDFVEVAVMGRDTLFVPASAQGLDAVWLRLRAQASISQWPVDAAHPVQARFVSRFGLRGDLLGERVPPSLLAGQVFWDGATVMAQDLDVAVPMGEPMLELHGSAGYNASHGPGLRLQAAVNDMARLGRVAGLADMGLAGSVRLTADMSRGGEHAGWWAKPLEQPPSLVANPLPGFALLLPDKGGAPQVRDLPAAVAGARASQSPTALHAAIGLEVPSLTLPQGTIEGVKLSLEASSADAETAPKGTTSRKADAQAGSQAAQGEASNTPSGQVDADFTALGLPKAIVGRCDLAIASLLGMGDAAFGARWLAAGWPGEADVFQVQLDDLRLKFPGGSLKGDMGLAYALPVRRMWPWLDGAISVNIDNWNTISRLASTPIRGEGVGVDVALESLYDPQGRARQYLKAQFRAGRVSTPDFAVSALAGRAESQHVHALADAVSLAANPGRQGSTSPEPEPTADLSLLDASISMGAGAGGPLNWKTGSCAVRVAGEQGTFNAQLQGALDASVSGSYDFRQRLLKVQDMKLSYLVPAEKLPADAALVASGMGRKNPLAGSVRLKQHPVGLQLGQALTLDMGAGEQVKLSGVRVNFAPAGALTLDASLPLAGDKPLTCALNLKDLPLDVPHGFAHLAMSLLEKGKAPPAWLASFPHGTLNAALNLNGAMTSPRADVRLGLKDIVSAAALQAPPLHLDVTGQLRPAGGHSVLELAGALKGLPGGGSGQVEDIALGDPRFTARVPLRLAGANAGLAQDVPLQAQASWGGALAPLLELYPLPGQKISGTAGVRVDVQGTAGKPRINARAVLRNGAFEDILNGVALKDITLDGRYASGAASTFTLHMGDGRGGVVDVKGSLTEKAQGAPALAAQGKIARFRPLRRPDLAIQLSGDVSVNGPLTAPAVKGNIVLDEGSYELLQGLGGSSVRALDGVVITEGTGREHMAKMATRATPAAPRAAPAKSGKKSPRDRKKAAKSSTDAATATVAANNAGPHLDVRVSAPGKFFVRGEGLNSEWRTELRITGAATDPRIVGYVAPVRGTFDLVGKEFRFTEGKVSFDGASPPNPALDLRMELSSGQVTAYVEVRGTGRNPKLDLTSEPPLPRDEVMAQVLFGKSMNQLSHFETVQAATAAAQLAGMGPAGLASLNTVRKGLGLDALRMGRAGGGDKQQVGRGMSSGMAGSVGGDTQGAAAGPGSVVEAGKYVTDSIYVGVEQGLRPQDGTGVRVDMELTPNITLSGRTSQQSSGVGLEWKFDY